MFEEEKNWSDSPKITHNKMLKRKSWKEIMRPKLEMVKMWKSHQESPFIWRGIQENMLENMLINTGEMES